MKTKTALLILLAGLSAFSSWAQTNVITIYYSNFGFSFDTSQDLIYNVLPTSTGVTPQLATSFADPYLYTLTDGQAPTTIPNYNGYNLLQNGVILVWDMGAPATINEIQTYSDWLNNGRVIQDYTVDVSADGTNWTNGVVAVVNQGGAASGSWPGVAVVVTKSDGSPLAKNARFVRFNFPSTQNGGVGYQEFVVNGVSSGTPSAPVFTVIPQSQTVTNGKSATFTAQATGFPPPLITWHFVDTNSTDNLLPVYGNTLTFQVNLGSAGEYYAVATNPSGSTNSTPAAVLTVVPGMVTETDDNSGNPFAGVGANPFAGASTNDLILGNSGTNIALNNFDTQNGWTVANLTDGNVQGPASVGNGVGVYSIIGNSGTITYNLGAPCGITGIETWTGWAGGGRDNQDYTVLYSLDGTTFIPLWTVAFNPNSGSHGCDVALAITGLTNVVSIRFNFSANQQNNGVAFTELAVYGTSPFSPKPPVFTVIPQSQTVTNDQSVTFTAQATGYPLPSFTWHFVDTNSIDHLIPTLGNTYTIPLVNILTDVGHYYVVASNPSGTTNSPLAQLTVIPNGVLETDLKYNGSGTFTGLGANDLILNNGGDASALSIVEPTGGWTTTNLTDGDLKEPGTIGNGTGVYGGIGGGNVTYNLGGGANSAGYDINGAEVWTSWNGDRIWPNFIFSYSYDGVNFINLQTVNFTGYPAPGGADVSLAIDVIHNVRSVRYTFPSTQENGWVSYTELAAYGVDSSGAVRALSAARDYFLSTQVSVEFAQALSPVTATNPANYTINNGVTVSSATYSTNSSGLGIVVLTTSPLSLGTAYVVTINNVQAAAGGTITPNTQLPVSMPVGLISDAVRTTTASGTNIMVVLEAENYNAATTNSAGFYWVLTTTPNNLLAGANSTNYSGTGVMEAQPYGGANVVNYGNNTTGPELSYKVYFTAAGTYYPWVRGVGDAPPGANNQRSIVLGLDNQVITASSGFVSTNGYSWLAGGFSSPNLPYTVSAGFHTVNVWMRQSGFDFDKLVLTTDPNYVPSASNTVPNNNIGPAASPGPAITTTQSGAKLVFTWVGGGTLQSSTNVVGTYTDIVGSSSPWTNTPAGAKKFYRVRQ